MKSLKLFFTLITVSIFACNNDNSINEGDPRDKFIGSYYMTKLESGEHYTMFINLLGEQCHNCDSLQILNFGDLFDTINYKFYTTAPDYWIYYPFFNPINDKNNYRWKLTSSGNPESPFYCNAVWSDSIKIQFKISNYYYYQEDGISFWDTVFTHVGSKID